MLTRLHGVAICSRCPVGPSDAISLTSGLGALAVSLCGLCWPSCFNWILIAVSLYMGQINCQAGRLWGLTPTTVCKLLCWCSLEVSCGAQWHSLSNNLSSVLQECFLWVICTPCCNQGLNAVSPFVDGVNPSGWVSKGVNLYHYVWNTVQGLSPKQGCSQLGPVPARITLFIVPLVWLVG